MCIILKHFHVNFVSNWKYKRYFISIIYFPLEVKKTYLFLKLLNYIIILYYIYYYSYLLSSFYKNFPNGYLNPPIEISQFREFCRLLLAKLNVLIIITYYTCFTYRELQNK